MLNKKDEASDNYNIYRNAFPSFLRTDQILRTYVDICLDKFMQKQIIIIVKATNAM